METVWIVTGKRIDKAEADLSDQRRDGAIVVNTTSWPVLIRRGRWFRSRRGAQMMLRRNAAVNAKRRSKKHD
jgi:hypothetical protein